MLLYSYISHLYEETLPPDFVIGLFQINKDGDRIFVHLESIFNFLCSVGLLWCSLLLKPAWHGVMILLCSSHQFRRSIIILSTSVPIYDVSHVGFVAGWSLFALFFFSKCI